MTIDSKRHPFLDALFKRRPESNIKPGLERIELGYKKLKFDSYENPSVLIAGTNGKGSTGAFLWKIASSFKKTTGLFTSPHLFSFSERFLVTGKDYSLDFIEASYVELKDKLGPEIFECMSFFELAALLAFEIFRSEKTQLDIIEVGLGGRFDATNISSPDVSVIVSIGLDHQFYLGETLQEIAFEKAGVMRQGKPVFIGESPDNPWEDDVLSVILKRADDLSCPVFRYGKDFGQEKDGNFFVLKDSKKTIIDNPLPKTTPDFLKVNFLWRQEFIFTCLILCNWINSPLRRRKTHQVFGGVFRKLF
jgi:dihydrofolate synthase/folylpolyglutamate synthase